MSKGDQGMVPGVSTLHHASQAMPAIMQTK
jgi:hypothetical protein